jgi:hypothetical protein
MRGEVARRHDRPALPACDFFEPRREVDGRTDAGEIQPIAAADIP